MRHAEAFDEILYRTRRVEPSVEIAPAHFREQKIVQFGVEAKSRGGHRLFPASIPRSKRWTSSLFAHSATDRLWPGRERSDDLTTPQPDDRANKKEQNCRRSRIAVQDE